MKTSDAGVKAIMLREGKRNKAYPDVKGIWSIGVGHTGPEVKPGLVWTEERITAALANDLEWAEAAVNKYVTVPLTQNQFDALVSFIFNIGVKAFKNSTMLRDLNKGDYEKAAKDFDMWHIPPEIIGRRDSEKQQFLS